MQVTAREPAERHRDEQSRERRVLDPLPSDRDPVRVLVDGRHDPARSPGVAATRPVVSTSASRRQYDAWPGSLSSPGSSAVGSASRLITTGRPPCAARQMPTVEAPVPPGSGCQPGSGSHMASTLVDLMPKMADVEGGRPDPRR